MKNAHNTITFHHSAQKNYISIIIPAHKRTHLLINTIKTVTTQTLKRNQYEVIIGNDGGDPEVKHICDKHNVTCIDITPHQGSYVARNGALAHARGEIIAFIDSDIIVPPDWLEKGRQYIKTDDYIGGPVVIEGQINQHADLRCEDCLSEPQNAVRGERVPQQAKTHIGGIDSLYTKIIHLFQTYEYHTAYKASAYLNQFHFLLTGNLFVHRKVIEAIGGFDRRLQSNGDFEFGDRVWRADYTQQYMRSLEVIHPPTTYMTMLRKQQRLANGSVSLHRIYPQRFPNQNVPVFKTLLKMWIPRFDMTTFRSLPFPQYICMYLIRYSFHIVHHFWKIWYTVIQYKNITGSQYNPMAGNHNRN